MKLTIPQMIMLNHAAWVEYENTQKRFESKRVKKADVAENDPFLEEGSSQRMSDLEKDSAAMDRYFAGFGKLGL